MRHLAPRRIPEGQKAILAPLGSDPYCTLSDSTARVERDQTRQACGQTCVSGVVGAMCIWSQKVVLFCVTFLAIGETFILLTLSLHRYRNTY